MPTIDVSPAAGADDAWGRDNDATFDSSGVDIFATSNTNTAFDRHGGVRFAISGPVQGDTVDVAHLTITPTTTSADDANCDIVAHDAEDPADFSASATAETRTPDTSASVPWVQDGLGTSAVNSPSLVSIIQELWDADFGTDGKHIVLLLRGRTDANKTFAFHSRDAGSNYASLHIEYTAGGASQVAQNWFPVRR